MQNKVARRVCKTIFSAGCLTAMLGGCASARLEPQVSSLESRLLLLTQVEGSYVNVNWAGEAQSSDAPELRSAFDRAGSCSRPAMTELANKIEGANARRDELSTQQKYDLTSGAVDEMLATMDRCAAHEGLSVDLMFLLGTHQALSLRDWLDELYRTSLAFDAASTRLEIAREKEARLAQALSMGLAGMGRSVNPNLVQVRPYVRLDGTVVGGHLRTAPNDTCADNLNGC